MRFAPIPLSQRTPAQHELIQFYRQGWRSELSAEHDVLGGPLEAMTRAPDFLARLVSGLADYDRDHSTLPKRLVEFGILITARATRSSYEWRMHRPWAEREGIPADTIDSLQHGEKPHPMKEDEATLFSFLDELLHKQKVSDSTFNAATSMFGERGVVDICWLAGLYRAVALVLVAADANSSEVLWQQGSVE
ncbi:hypothetical protein GCM10023165_20460 [Variovorax defluvii]|uniref:Carboxymuconolactone decarboxylase family protein n=1 Tax=Variovorax defluvii TaxID=913761 RepID=A0ABP8HL86_9BURK